MDGNEIGAAVCVGLRDCYGHFAAQRRIGRLEFIHLNDFLVRHELRGRWGTIALLGRVGPRKSTLP
jgi:hypothetical protein